MSKSSAKGNNTVTIIVAVIGAVATIISALITSSVVGRKSSEASSSLAITDNQSLPIQSLRFNGTNLELAPALPTDVFVPIEPNVSGLLVLEHIWAHIWEAGIQDPDESNAALNGIVSYTAGGNASIDLKKLPSGMYFCRFSGLGKNSGVSGISVELYYNPKQLFRWDGTKGEFLS